MFMLTETIDWHRMAAMLFETLLVLGVFYLVCAFIVGARKLVLTRKSPKTEDAVEDTAGPCPRCKSQRTASLFSSLEDEDETESKVPTVRHYCVCWTCHFKWDTKRVTSTHNETPPSPRGAA